MKKKIFTIGTAHLDTVWNWTLEATVRRHIRVTFDENFKLFEKYPDYKFNFEGAYRYELMQEYYPEKFAKLKEYVSAGRWYPCGSSYENGDVNTPSPEALFRNILYGNEYFDKNFGIRSKDIYLPDCFGFGWALPSVMKHANLSGFYTQKLTWGSAYGIPFDMGRWYGVNGDFVYGMINMNGYGKCLNDKQVVETINKKIKENEAYDLPATAVFHGTGDIGGAPQDISVKTLEENIAKNNDEIEYLSSTTADVIDYLKDFDDNNKGKLPEHKNELVLTTHSTAGYTSRAIGKRWNKRNEILADMTERASVVAEVFGTRKYPKANIDKHWKRVIAHQFHDDLPGTSLQKVYERSWNDYGVSLNGFKNEYLASIRSMMPVFDTNGEGIALMVHNPLEYRVKAPVTVNLTTQSEYIKVVDYAGNIVPSQIIGEKDGKKEIVFIADVSSVGYKKYLVQSASAPYESSEIKVSDKIMENQKYIVKLDDNGDVSSIFDKSLKKELLSEPIRNVLFKYMGSSEYPAWEMPVDYVSYPDGYATLVKSEIVANGGCKVAIKVTQKYGDSTFSTIISLANGGERVDFDCELDWRGMKKLLKRDFKLAVSNGVATYDLGIGTIKRGNNSKKLYEVPAQNFADVTSTDNSYGVSILSDCKFGWDKPADNELRLTVVHTPYYSFRMTDSFQHKMDLGLNRYAFSIYSHKNEVGKDTQKEARLFIEPPIAFAVDKHKGKLEEYSFANVSDDGIMLKALKKAENSEEYVVRFYESENKSHKGVTLEVGKGILSARELYASEEYIGEGKVEDGKLIFDMKPYEVKTFAITVEKAKLSAFNGAKIKLLFNSPLTTSNADRTITIVGKDYSLPKELWQKEINACGIDFDMGDVMLADNQKIDLPTGAKKLYIVASSLTDDKKVEIKVGDKTEYIGIASAKDRVARWDLIGHKETANVKTDAVAFEITHTHAKKADKLCELFYGFVYEIDIENAKYIQMPKDKDVAIFAMTVDKNKGYCELTTDLYDVVKRRAYNFSFGLKSTVQDMFKKMFYREYKY